MALSGVGLRAVADWHFARFILTNKQVMVDNQQADYLMASVLPNVGELHCPDMDTWAGRTNADVRR